MTFPKQPLSHWLRQIEQSLASRRLLRDGQKILVAVSGGLDSMVLLRVLHQLAGPHQWKLTVAHFNHQLRGAAGDADERLVLQTARRLGWPAFAGRADVAKAAQAAGISLEMAGRKLRHDFLARTARRLRIPSIALAHHADDQVELFFLRLLRGTGGRGLAGMQWSNLSPSAASLKLVRPLLDQTKDALRKAAQALGACFSDDATNASLDIHRNRVRHELLPLLRKHYQPRLSERVLSLMELAGAEAEVASELAARWLAAKRRVKFDRLPVAVQRQVVYMQLLRLGQSPDFDLVEKLRERVDERVAVGPEQWLTRDASGLVRAGKMVAAEFNSERLVIVLTSRKRQLEFGGLALKWEIEVGTAQPAKRAALMKYCRGVPTTEYFDADKVGRKVGLRHWQPGDRFQPIGMKSARKLQDLFTDLKVPRDQRHQRIVAATSQGEIFWVEGLRMAEGFKLGPGTVRRLQWQWRRQ
jgi:tRNA(Ile)-lysidine synthase